jgi:predicted DNA-binding protein
VADKTPPLIVENFPAELKQRLRVLAAQQNTTMRQIVIDSVERGCGAREDYVRAAASLPVTGSATVLEQLPG